MPSPDFSPYVDLTIYDKEAGQIYLDAISYAQTVALPEFNPRVGSIEDALLQAVAYATSELVGSINRLPNGLMEGILNLYGFERQQAVSASVQIQVTLINNLGGTIPAGALFSYTTEGEEGLDTYFFATVADLVVPAGLSVGTVTAEALTVGVIPTISSNTELTPVSGVARVLSAQTSGAMTQGEDDEPDESYFSRGTAFLASRSESLATSQQMQNFLNAYANEIQRAYVSDLTNFRYMRVSQVTRTNSQVTAQITGLSSATEVNDKLTFLAADAVPLTSRVICRYVDDSGTSTKINGTALSGSLYVVQSSSYSAGTYTLVFTTNSTSDTGVVYTPASTAPHNSQSSVQTVPNDRYIEILLLPSDYNEHNGAVGLVFGNQYGNPIQNSAYSNVQDEVESRSVAGLKFTSIAPLLVPVTVTVQVEHAPTYAAVPVREAVKVALENYLSPANWVFGKSVFVNNLIGVASGVTGVSRIASLTLAVGTGGLSALGTYSSTGGGVVEFEYPFCLPIATVTSSGVI